MSEVKRYDFGVEAEGCYAQYEGEESAGGEYVKFEDFDRVTADRDALQALLTAADERADVLETALAGMLFAFDDGVGRDWSEDLLDFARKLTTAKEFNTPLKPAEPPLPEGWYGVDCEENNREPGITVLFGSGTEISSYGKCSRYLPYKKGVEIHCGASVNGVIYYCAGCKP